MSSNIRSSYRTMLSHLVRLPDMEMQSFYRHRYRYLCRAASAALDGTHKAVGEGAEASERAGKEMVRKNRYMAQIRRETRRLESISRYLSMQHIHSSPCYNLANSTVSSTYVADRSSREERKYALKAYERMVDATYARTGKRRWEVLEALYPSSIRTPSRPRTKDEQPNQRNLLLVPAAPPVIPAYLKPLEKTVNLTVQAHREKKLKEIYGSSAYKEAIAVRREWKRWSKFMKGVAVPLPDSLLQSVQRAEYDTRTTGAILRLLWYESFYAEGKPAQPSINVSTSGTASGTSLESKLPRPVRRIHERMIARVPVLPVIQNVDAPSMAPGKGKATVVAGAGTKGWVPPPASDEDIRWIPGACSV